jgi:hypothetical protein
MNSIDFQRTCRYIHDAVSRRHRQSSRGHPLRHRSPEREPNGFAARLRSVIDAHGGASCVARDIARSEGAVRKWLRAESEPNVTDLRAICETTATNIGWLVSGSGEADSVARGENVPRDAAPEECALLENLLLRVDAELAKAQVVLASTQRSALIVTLYQLFRSKRSVDPEALSRLVRLAQA